VALNCLLEHVELEMQGDCSPQTLFEILLRAASKHDSIEHTINSLAGAPSGKTIPYHLDKMKRWVVFRQENFDGSQTHQNLTLINVPVIHYPSN